MRRENKREKRQLIGYRIYANRKDGKGHVPISERNFKTPVTANNEVTRLMKGKHAGDFSKPLAIPVFV
jgi:hypothetical protein